MQRISLVAFVAAFVLSPLALAGETRKEHTSATEQKVAKLLQQWKATTAQDATTCSEAKAKLQAEFAAVAKACPVGSRMDSTLSFINKVLEASIAGDEACAKSCASAKAEGETKSPCEGAKLAAARGKLLVNLRELTTHALAAMPGSTCDKSVAYGKGGATLASTKKGFCQKKAAAIVASLKGETCNEKATAILVKEVKGLSCKKKAAELAAAIQGETCADKATALLLSAASELKPSCDKAVAGDKTAANIVASANSACAKNGAACGSACGVASGAACSGDLVLRGTAIRASWKTAAPESAAMCPVKRKELQASVESLSERSAQVALLPPTILALSEGFDALESYNTQLAAFGKANPEAMKAIPADRHKIFERQFALIHSGAEVLRLVRTTLQAAAGASTEEKTETSSSAD